MKIIVAPSILACDFVNLGMECEKVLQGTNWLHVDIMDGHFVPNLTLGPTIVKSLRKRFPTVHLDCHLMVNDPFKWVQPFIRAGASSLTIHWESFNNDVRSISKCIEMIKANGHCQIGMALKPATKVANIPIEIYSLIDFVLVMTVEPGFGGQTIILECLQKISQIRNAHPNLPIQVDGGITLDNYQLAVKEGATNLVAGTAIFGADNPLEVVKIMSSPI